MLLRRGLTALSVVLLSMTTFSSATGTGLDANNQVSAQAVQYRFRAGGPCLGDAGWRVRVEPRSGKLTFQGAILIRHAKPLSRWSIGYKLEYTDGDGVITTLYETAVARADKQGNLEHTFGGTTHWRYLLDFDASDGEALCHGRARFRY